jgi:NhaP-type Na+/H+ or K+/H+ antiporter
MFGESVLNDAVSIVLYKLFLNLRGAESSSTLPLLAVVKFFVVSLGGVICGTLMAILGLFLSITFVTCVFP